MVTEFGAMHQHFYIYSPNRNTNTGNHTSVCTPEIKIICRRLCSKYIHHISQIANSPLLKFLLHWSFETRLVLVTCVTSGMGGGSTHGCFMNQKGNKETDEYSMYG